MLLVYLFIVSVKAAISSMSCAMLLVKKGHVMMWKVSLLLERLNCYKSVLNADKFVLKGIRMAGSVSQAPRSRRRSPQYRHVTCCALQHAKDNRTGSSTQRRQAPSRCRLSNTNLTVDPVGLHYCSTVPNATIFRLPVTYANLHCTASGVSLSPSESVNVGKRKAPEDGFGDHDQVCCPCGAGPCTLLESNKLQSKGRHYFICPKDQV